MAKPSKSVRTAKRAVAGRAGVRRAGVEILPVVGLPEIRKGDDVVSCMLRCCRRGSLAFEQGDVLVIAQKIISKAEGRLLRLGSVKPSTRAIELAAKLHKDARLIEVILRESRRIVRADHVLIVETHHGLVCANAGVDQSNVPGKDVVSLLPRDPDGSARRVGVELRKRTGKDVAVIISDTFGRPWRLGLTNVAIGAAGVPALIDLRGTRDRDGKPLHATMVAVADELAAAAGLVMEKDTGVPAAIIRGYRYRAVLDPASRIVRPAGEDLFR
jgi:coenzyme F420-0:L-glutamate ligase / coenzyme F420-1:gamma-L-glutamate ligase